MPELSPTPWRSDAITPGGHVQIRPGAVALKDACGLDVGVVVFQDIAARILPAVNLHEELVENLRLTIQVLESLGNRYGFKRGDWPALDDSITLLAKARGEGCST